MRWLTHLVILGAMAVVACSPGVPNSTGSGQTGDQSQAPSARSSGPKILLAAINEDPKNFWDGINGGGGGGARELGHMVNQYLVNIGPDGQPMPRLLTELPSVAKGTWRVGADGKMEVTYKLRTDVTWHDGTPLTADDLIFSWEVGRDPAIPNGNQVAQRAIERVVAEDPHTAVFSWSQTYAFADRLEHREFYPLPKHLLETAYRESKDTLISQPYFSEQYVGLGPFKVTSWEHGSALDLVANDAYFLGRPKLDRVRIQFITDPNTALASFRSGALNIFLPNGGPDWDQLAPLKQEWQPTGKGDVVIERVRWAFVEPQKSSLAQPSDLHDVRMRQALLLAMNREELTRSLQGELGGVADAWVHPAFSYYPQVRDAITQYPYDARRASALLAELGWTPGPDGILQKAGARLQIGIRPDQAQEKEATIIQQDWKAVGIDGQIEVLSNVLLRDAEARANFAGTAVSRNPMGGLSAVRRFATEQIPTAANRFAGTNRGQYANPEWDSVGLRLRTALDDEQRLQYERELLKILTTDLPVLPFEYELQPIPVLGVKGLQPVTGTAHTGNIMHTWNIHEWDLS